MGTKDVMDASLGQLGMYISRKNGLVNQLISNKTKEGRAEFKNKIRKITKFRNKIMHNLLKTFIGISIDRDIPYDDLINRIDMYLKFHDSTYSAVYGNKGSQSSPKHSKVVSGNISKDSNVKFDTVRILANEAKNIPQNDEKSHEEDTSLDSQIKSLEEKLMQAEAADKKEKKFKIRIMNNFVVGHGLSNLGNTCYMNSVLQVFSHLKLFKEKMARI